jgi:hypothetical protein
MATTLSLAKTKPSDAPVNAPPPSEEMVWIVAVNGRMLNLLTDVWLTADPKYVALDPYVAGQLEAKKLAIFTP